MSPPPASRPTAALGAGLLTVLTLGIALGLWWILSEQGPARLDPPAASSPDREEASTPPVLHEPLPGPMREEVPRAPEAGRLDPETARTLDLLGRTRLFGTVQHADGERIAGARVWWDGKLVARADSRGEYDAEFAWSPVAPGSYGWLYAEDPGVACDLQRAPARGGRVDFDLRSYGKVQGTVFSDPGGERLVHARVELQIVRSEDDLPPRPVMQATATTDDRGHFTFTGVPAGTLALRAQHPEYESSRWSRIESPGDVFNAALKLRAKQVLRGQFVPWPPPPPHDRGLRVRAGSASDVPDAEGRFRLALPATPGSAQWLLLECDSGLLFARAGRSSGDLGPLRLRAPAFVEGSVTGLRGESAAALEAVAVCQQDRLLWPEPLRAAVGEDGRFRLGPLPAGPILFSVVLADKPLAPARPLQLVAGEIHRLPPVQPRVLLIWGQVRDEAGRAIPGVNVSVEHDLDRGAPWKALDTQRSDAEGRFAFALTPQTDGSTRRLVAVHPRRLLPCRVEVLPTTPGLQHHDLVLRRGLVQRGRVEAPDPQGWTVVFDSEDLHSLAVPTTREGRVDTDGSFAVDGLEERGYRVELRDREGRVQSVQVRRPSKQTWVLSPDQSP